MDRKAEIDIATAEVKAVTDAYEAGVINLDTAIANLRHLGYGEIFISVTLMPD